MAKERAEIIMGDHVMRESIGGTKNMLFEKPSNIKRFESLSGIFSATKGSRYINLSLIALGNADGGRGRAAFPTLKRRPAIDTAPGLLC